MEKAIPELGFSHITIKRTKIAAAPIKGHFRLIVPLMKWMETNKKLTSSLCASNPKHLKTHTKPKAL